MKYGETLDQTAPGPLWRRIATDLTRAIEHGNYAPGDALPTATELSARYGVHRHTVRQAYRYLAELGLASSQQGRGTFVTKERIPYRIGRRVSFSANFAALGLKPQSRLLDYSPTQAAAVPDSPFASTASLWRLRTLSALGGLPISTSTHYLDQSRFADFPERLVREDGSISAALAGYGIESYHRLSTRLKARTATEIETRLLGLSENAPVLHTSGIDGTDDRTVLQLVESCFVSDRIEIVIEPE